MMENISLNMSIEALTSKFLEGGGLTAPEEAEMRQLLNNPDCREYFRNMYAIWYGGKKTASEEDMERALQKALFRINKSLLRRTQAQRRVIYGRVAAAAAAIIIAVATWYFASNGGISTFHANETTSTAMENRVIVPFGSKSTVELPDGTTVILNAGSSLQYSAAFGEQTREIELEGEGYFVVARNEAIPFVVKVKDVLIRALGTEFNVTAYPEEETVRTTLVSGSVSIRHERNNADVQELILMPKQTATIFVNTPENEIIIENQRSTALENIVVSDVIVEEGAKQTLLYTSWKDERWIIEGESLEDLAMKMQRRYNVRIFIIDEELKSYPFSGIFTDETLEQMLEIIKLVVPVKYAMNRNDVMLSIDARRYEIYKKSMTY